MPRRLSVSTSGYHPKYAHSANKDVVPPDNPYGRGAFEDTDRRTSQLSARHLFNAPQTQCLEWLAGKVKGCALLD
jgi:hypothetical protein